MLDLEVGQVIAEPLDEIFVLVGLVQPALDVGNQLVQPVARRAGHVFLPVALGAQRIQVFPKLVF
jgi:hypothetical protein